MYIKTYEGTFEVDRVDTGYQDELQFDGMTFTIFPTHEAAGEAAREYWEDMVNNDPEEFAAMVGEKTLVSWALGQWAGPGSTQVRNLDEWLDLYLDAPEEHHAHYDGAEIEAIRLSPRLCEELEYTFEIDPRDVDAVLYRTD